ncbi:Long-chain-fatty-acid--CoA ligase [Georgfuchsia toluolica]|uniref:Long-chain-fatty-acid--CoA ligase n=1 Tax=Georgfuchsia toluolica TaxID=424218 RepID=A0A916J5X5_9PROT|nr:AMP-binding protein [Georgfuchsia toluolica]CAG4885144.1 Long-chain-fatty-acid--CoA ligase [Georgfuchsia toluolica]
MWRPDFERDQRTIGYLLADRANRHPDKVFCYTTGEEITYAQLAERVNRVANSFLDLGVRKGDNVSVMMSNCPEYIYTWFALAKIGAVEAVMNTAFKGETLGYFLNYGGAKVAVIDEDLVERFFNIQGSLNDLEKLIVRKVPTEGKVPNTRFETIPYAAMFEGAPSEPKCEPPRFTDPVSIMYTSGTTGPSKGVVYCHNFCYTVTARYIQILRLTPEDKLYNCLPLFHMNAQFLSVLPTLVLGATCVLVDRFSASRFWEDIRQYDATVFNFLGPMINVLWNQPERDDDALVPVRVALGVPVPAHLERPFEKRFGLKLIQCLGATETGIVTATPWDQDTPIGSCGKPLPGCDVRVVDENDNDVPPGVRGELVYRPQDPFAMMSEYYKKPEATVEATRNLWYHYGDYGRRDENGFFYFVDRKKDCMRRRGENISASEVEAVVNRYPGVMESAASGVWADMGEEEIKISIRLMEGATVDPLDLLRFCEEGLPWFAVPRYVEFRDDFPRTPNGKVAKFQIKEEGVHPKLWDREAAGYQIKRR